MLSCMSFFSYHRNFNTRKKPSKECHVQDVKQKYLKLKILANMVKEE